LLPNGTVSYNWLEGRGPNGGSWLEQPKPSIVGHVRFAPEPAKQFSAMAFTDDAIFYGISSGQVMEYVIDKEDSTKLNFVGVVFG
jgi:hypothetical protein